MALLIPLVACTNVRPLQVEQAQSSAHAAPRVLLMPPDVLLLEVATAGLPLPRADWTGKAEQVLFSVLEQAIATRGGELLRYRAPANGTPFASEHVTAIALHNTIVDTLLTYRYQGRQTGKSALPTRAEGLNWTLGESVQPLREEYDADYALFLIYRHASASPGRALLAAGMLLFGVIQPTSQAIGFASLVDLHNGQIVWTNLLSSQGLDTSQPDGLAELGQRLIEAMPL